MTSPRRVSETEVAPLLEKRDSTVIFDLPESDDELNEAQPRLDVNQGSQDVDPLAFWQGLGIGIFFGPIAVAVVLWLKSAEHASTNSRRLYVRGSLYGLAIWLMIIIVMAIHVINGDSLN